MKNINFSNYLAGLIEGDGTIFVPTKKRGQGNRKSYPSVQICFHSKDLPLFLLVQQRLNSGSLNRKKGKNAYIYTLNSSQGIERVCSLINGRMRTPKIYDLWKLIDWLNNERAHLSIPKKEKNKGELVEDAWLSGFIEADGHFFVRATLSKFKIECKFELVQSMIDHNNNSKLCILEKIGKVVHSSVKTTRQSQQRGQYRVRTVNLAGNRALEEYFTNFPLFGAKLLDFKDWCTVLNLFKRGVHNKKEYYDKIVCIKRRMNQNRNFFEWDHLKDFYHLEE